VNLRGNIIPVLDLRKFFGLSEKGMTDATRIIIVDSAGAKTGIIVDSVSEVLRFEKALIEPPPELLSNGIDSSYVEGVGKLDDGKRIVLILRLDKILDFERISA
jgi:purine-binding chemotaxis protein CheW